jgi:hypothetical protein
MKAPEQTRVFHHDSRRPFSGIEPCRNGQHWPAQDRHFAFSAPESYFTEAERAAARRANRPQAKQWPGVLRTAKPDLGRGGLFLPQYINVPKGIGWGHVSEDRQLRPAHGAEFYPTELPICLAALRQYQQDRPAPRRILDMGAGTGPWGQAAREIWPEAIIVGIELRNIMSSDHGRIDPTLPTFDPDCPPPTIATAGRSSLAPWYDIWITGSLADPTALDLAKSSVDGAFDLIMGNPPFSFAAGIVDWAWHEGLNFACGRLFMLLRGAFLESDERKALNDRCPLARYMVFVKRPSFTQDGKTDATMYALFEWDRTWRAEWFKGYRFDHRQDVAQPTKALENEE